MSKHTPGKWIAKDNEVFRPASSGSISPYYKQICSFVNTGNDECKANAKLIAASPDLLEALTTLVKAVKTGGDYSAAIEAACIAINKAIL